MQQKSSVSAGSLLLALAEAMPNREANGAVGSQVSVLNPRGWLGLVQLQGESSCLQQFGPEVL